MTIYWMLNNHWPSFFGNIFDYYLRPGGAYFGAKKGLRPLSAVFDSYATGDHSQANVTRRQPDARTTQRTSAPGCASTTCRAELRDDRTSDRHDRRIRRRGARADAAAGGARLAGVLRPVRAPRRRRARSSARTCTGSRSGTTTSVTPTATSPSTLQSGAAGPT